MDTQTIQNLFSQVSAINKKYEKIAEITGENFNIFKILRIESKEVLTHSRFLCELLNPKGSHGKESKFLELFLESQKIDKSQKNENFIKRFEEFKIEHCTVKLEAHIIKNADNTDGGRIDILLKDNSSNAIIIENKIYAGDQHQQLVRYSIAHKEAPIFYLTLDGSEPSANSSGDLIKDNHFKCISYQKDILEWLINCRKESVENPILREAITQYINLIKHLTGQTMNDEMKNDIFALLKRDNNIELAFEISRSLIALNNKLKIEFQNQIKEIGEKLKIKVEGLKLIPSNWTNHSICFRYEQSGIIYGIVKNETDNNVKRIPEIDALIKIEMNKIFQASPWWPMWDFFYKDIESVYLFWEDIKNGEAKRKAMEFVALINDHFNNDIY